MYAQILPQLLSDTLAKNVVQKFDAYVASTRALKWFIASDFVVGDKSRYSDTFAFSLIPYDDTIENLFSEVDTAGMRDIKKIKQVSPAMLEFLRDPRRFHFVLIADRGRNWPRDAKEAREAIDSSLTMMGGWADAADQSGVIRPIQSLRQEANAKNFNYGLFGDIVLLATVTAYFAAMLVRTQLVEGILWAPDRDKMTIAYSRIAAQLVNINFAGICQRWNISDDRQAQARLGFAIHQDDTTAMWFDSFVRIADFLAGTVASWDIESNEVLGEHPKFKQVLQSVIADNPNVEILRLRMIDPPGPSLARVTTSLIP